jgi:transcriptional regulator with GAF, ATPase, and Fis domain
MSDLTPSSSSNSRAREINLLHRISQVLGFDLSLSDVLQVIVSVTADLMESKIVSILLYDEAARSLSIAATQSLSPAYRDKPSVSVDRSVSGKALLAKQPQVIADVQTDDSFGFREVAKAEGIVGMLSEDPLWAACVEFSSFVCDELKLASTLPSMLRSSQKGKKASKPTPTPNPNVEVVWLPVPTSKILIIFFLKTSDLRLKTLSTISSVSGRGINVCLFTLNLSPIKSL